MDVITQPLAQQPKPVSIPNSQILIDGKCEEVQEKVYLNGVRSPVLQIEDSYIVLERPIQRFYDGQWTAEYALETKDKGKIIYSQRFQVQITSLSNAMPKFKGHSRGQNLTTWEVHARITDVYELPVIEDSNQFDKVTISINFNAETSQFLRNCDCFSIDQEQRLLRVTLPVDYSQKSDSLSITIDDGKDSNTYPIQLKTKQWLIDRIIPIIEIYCSWMLLTIAFFSAIAGLPTFAIWGGIFCLQIVSHIPLFSVDLPLNELKFLVFLKRIVSFDLFDQNPLLGMGFTETKPLNQNFARLGYTSSNLFENLGTLPLFTTSLPVVLLFLKLCVSSTKFCKLKCSTQMNRFFSWALIWNICAQFFLLSLIELLIAAFIGLKLSSDLKGNVNSHDKVAIVSAYLCLIELGLFMLYVFYYAGPKNADMTHVSEQNEQNKQKDQEDNQAQSTDEEADPLRIYNQGQKEKSKSKVRGDELEHSKLQGSPEQGKQQERNQKRNPTIWTRDGYTLINGLREKSFLAGLFYFLFCLRRIVLVFIALLGNDLGHLQLTVYMIQTVLWLSYLISQPFEMVVDTFIEGFNELILLMIGARMIYLINSTMDYSAQNEFGIFTIIIVCLLILINLIRWIYWICQRIQKCADQKKSAQVTDKEIVLKDQNLFQQQNKFEKENQDSLEMSNAQLKNTIRGLLSQIDEDTEPEPTNRKADSSRFNQAIERPIPIPVNQEKVKPTTEEKQKNLKNLSQNSTEQIMNQSKKEQESNETSAVEVTISGNETISAHNSSSEENVQIIKRKSCKHHVLHKENCKKCIIADQNSDSKTKKKKLDARQKRKQKIAKQKIRLLAVAPSSSSSKSKTPRQGESIDSEVLKIGIKDNNLDFENEFTLQNQPFKGKQAEARLSESQKLEKTFLQENLEQQIQKINGDLVESKNLDEPSNQLLNAQQVQDQYKQKTGIVQTDESHIDDLQTENAEPKVKKVYGKIKVSQESDEMIQNSTGFEIKWNIEYSHNESNMGIVKNTNSNSVQDLSKLCLEKIVKDEVIHETQRNTAQQNDYELSQKQVKDDIIPETQRVTPQHNGCKISQIDLSELSITSKDLKVDSRHISINSMTQCQQSYETKELKNRIVYDQNEANISILSDYETENAEKLRQGIEKDSQRTLRVSNSCNAIDSRQSPYLQSHSEIEHKSKDRRVPTVDGQNVSENISPTSQQSVGLKDCKIQDLINTQAQLFNTVEPEIQNQNFESQSQQQEDLTDKLNELPQIENPYATVMDKEPHHKAQMTIQEFRQIRSATSDKETGMSSAVGYDTKVDCAKNSSVKMSLKTGQSDKMNFKGCNNSNFSPHTVTPQIQSKVVDLIILSNFNRRMMLPQIENAVVDIEILADQESNHKQNKGTVHDEYVKSAARFPFPAFGTLKKYGSQNLSEHIKSARTIPQPVCGLDSRQDSLETLSEHIRSMTELPLPTFGFEILSASLEIQNEETKSTASIPLPVFGIVTVQASITTSQNCSPTKFKISEESIAKLSSVEEKFSISQGGKKTEFSTNVNSQMPRLRKESGDFVNSMVILEQSINRNKEKSRPISAYPVSRHAKSLKTNQRILASETILNDESDYGDECVVIFSPNKKQKTQGKSGKRRYIRQKRDRTIPKSSVNPFEEPILKSTGWTNYQIDLASNNTKAREFLRVLNETGQLETLIPSSAFTSQKNNSKHARDNYVRSAAQQKNRKKNIQQILKDNQEKLKMSVTMPKSKSQWRVAPMSLNDSNESTEF